MPQLYARVFLQILDSSLADDWRARFVFEDFLKLSNRDGVVDMTRAAISRRTGVPLEIVTHGIEVLEADDPHSRDATEGGRRIVRLDDHRDWGWRIVNFERYDAIRTEYEMREAKAREMRRYRAKKSIPPTPPEIQRVSPNPDSDPTPPPEDPPHVGHASPTCSLHSYETEPPKGFPRTEKEASESASFVGCSPEFAISTWTICASRGWRDSKSVPIRSWRHYLASMWGFERNRQVEKRAAESARLQAMGKTVRKGRTHLDDLVKLAEEA